MDTIAGKYDTVVERNPVNKKLPYDDFVNIVGVPVNRLSFDETIRLMVQWALGPIHHQVATVNSEFVMMARRNLVFRNVLWRASLCIPDGIGVVWASHLLGKPVKERVTGVDAIRALAREGSRSGVRFFLLGSAPGVAHRAAEALRKENPEIIIAATYAGSPRLEDEDEICDRIRSAAPNVLLVGYGAPKQDLWIARTARKVNVPLVIGIGGTFDFLAGTVKRAPQWMQNNGLEWLFRLLQEPSRWRRMLQLPLFIVAVLLFLIKGK